MPRIPRERWDRKPLAESRAKREASSAPRPSDMKIYRKFFRQARRDRGSARVLVLGATPELRDLALDHGDETVAADMSWNVFQAMHSAMKHSHDAKNKVLLANWLELDKLLPADSFDIVLADVSINNLTIKDHSKLLRVIRRLLKSGGSFITRNSVISEDFRRHDLNFFQKMYDRHDLDWLIFFMAFVYQKESKLQSHSFAVRESIQPLRTKITGGKISFRKDDLWKVENVTLHGRAVVHTVLPVKRFEHLLGRYFMIKEKVNSLGQKLPNFVPIYWLKVRK